MAADEGNVRRGRGISQRAEQQHEEGEGQAAPRLTDVHVAENNRLAPGMGSIDWNAFVATLKEVKYDGALTMEAVAPIDRTPMCPWPNQVEKNPVDISPEQLKFIQDHGSSLLSEEFYTMLYETASRTLLPLIR